MTTGPDHGRRAALRAACRLCGAFSALGLGAAPARAQAVDPPAPTIPSERLVRPALDTEEGGLWAMMEREETKLRRSSFVVRETVLATYLQQLVCRLAGSHCQDVRVYLVKSPLFNANMAPNGMMQVWTGLLLRVDNEAQLAAVLGHEIGHFLERHSLQQLRDAKSKSATATFFAMFGLAGAVANLAVMASMFSFSREQESRADTLGMLLMQQAGYDGREAAAVWDNLLGELKVTGGEDAGRRSPMFATHPGAENRRDTLLRLAGDGSGGKVGREEFLLATAAHRQGWLLDEVRRGQYEESLVLFDRMLARSPADPLLLFAHGEVLRQRDGPGDLERCIDDLRRASSAERPPADAFRSLGLALRRRSDNAGAVGAFRHYLSAAPRAVDAGLIQQYIAELQP